MRLAVHFAETDQRLVVGFGEVHEVSDGGYDKGYAEGYGAGYTEGQKGEQWWLETFRQTADITGHFQGTQIETIPAGLDFSNAQSAPNVFRDCKKLATLPYINTVSAKTLGYFVYYTELLKELFINITSATDVGGLISQSKVKRLYFVGDFSTVKTANNMCLWSNVEEIRAFTDETMQEEIPLDLSNLTTGTAFNYAGHLVYVRPKPLSIRVGQNFGYSVQLPDEVAQYILDGLADLTGGTTQTLVLPSNVILRLTPEQKAAAFSKNWNIS